MKVLEDIDTLSGLMSWTVLPNFRTLGPRLGPKINEVKQALAAADGSALHDQLEADGFIEVAGERLDATTSRSGPNATRPSPCRRTTVGRSRSTSSSTTTCAPKGSPASSCAR